MGIWIQGLEMDGVSYVQKVGAGGSREKAWPQILTQHLDENGKSKGEQQAQSQDCKLEVRTRSHESHGGKKQDRRHGQPLSRDPQYRECFVNCQLQDVGLEGWLKVQSLGVKPLLHLWPLTQIFSFLFLTIHTSTSPWKISLAADLASPQSAPIFQIFLAGGSIVWWETHPQVPCGAICAVHVQSHRRPLCRELRSVQHPDTDPHFHGPGSRTKLLPE